MAIGYGVSCPKPTTRKTLKGRKTRAEATVKTSVRTQCVERDGHCRLFQTLAVAHDGWAILAALYQIDTEDQCDGPSEWAHMHARRRSKTRGQAPAQRHTTMHTLMLCRRHHDEYDGRQSPRLIITALTRKGADGPLKFTRGAK